MRRVVLLVLLVVVSTDKIFISGERLSTKKEFYEV